MSGDLLLSSRLTTMFSGNATESSIYASGGLRNETGGGENTPEAFEEDSRPEAEKTRSVARSPLFTHLNGEEIDRLNWRCKWRHVRSGGIVWNETANDYPITIVARGCARALRYASGQEIILEDIREGGHFGAFAPVNTGPGRVQILAVTDVMVAHIPAPVLRDLMYRFPGVAERLLAELTERVHLLSARLAEQRLLDARGRLCAELLRLSRRTAANRVAVSPPPSHIELAARVGGCRESVTRALISLDRAGLISRSRGAISLTDCDRLMRIAGVTAGRTAQDPSKWTMR